MADLLNTESIKEICLKHEEFKLLLKDEECQQIKESDWNSCVVRLKAEEIIAAIDKLLESLDTTDKLFLRLQTMKAVMLYKQSKLLVEGDNVDCILKFLQDGYTIVSALPLDSIQIYTYFRITNHLSYYLHRKGDYSEARAVLEKACAQYENMPISSCYDDDDLFSTLDIQPDPKAFMQLETVVSNNILLLSYIYHELGDLYNFAKTNHCGLKRQLEMGEGDPIEWNKKVLHLAKFFVYSQQFSMARHHLAAAHYLIDGLKQKAENKNENSENIQKETLDELSASLATCWVEYGLEIFSCSKKRMAEKYLEEDSPRIKHLWSSKLKLDLDDWCKSSINKNKEVSGTIQENGDVGCKLEKCKEQNDTSNENNAEDKVKLHDLNDESPRNADEKSLVNSINNTYDHDELDMTFVSLKLSEIEDQVTCQLITNSTEAESLFLFTFAWLRDAKEYFTFRDHPCEYLSCLIDLNELHKNMVFFENDPEEQYKIHRLRQEIIETIIRATKEVDIARKAEVLIDLLRELSGVHTDLLTLSLYQIQEEQSETDNFKPIASKIEAMSEAQYRLAGLSYMLNQSRDENDKRGNKSNIHDPKLLIEI